MLILKITQSYVQCRRFSGAGLRHQGAHFLSWGKPGGLDWEWLQPDANVLFSAAEDSISFAPLWVSKLRFFQWIQDEHSFAMSVPFVVVDTGGLSARKRMRRSPSSTAWPATTPSLCLATFQDEIAHVANLTFFALLSQPRTCCRPLQPQRRCGHQASEELLRSTYPLTSCIICGGRKHVDAQTVHAVLYTLEGSKTWSKKACSVSFYYNYNYVQWS